MALEAHAQPRKAVAVQPTAAPDYIAVTQQNDKRITDHIGNNPVYQLVIDGNTAKEQRVTAVGSYLLSGLEDGTAKEADMDKRRAALIEINNFIQILRRQLGSEQAKAITQKAWADNQRIINQTSEDVGKFESKIEPLGRLSELLKKYGAEGNIIQKINLAKEQQQMRERDAAVWRQQHALQVLTASQHCQTLRDIIRNDETILAHRWWNKKPLETSIENYKSELAQAETDLTTLQNEQPPETISFDAGELVDEGILELQNIGGPAFKAAVTELRDDTELTLAKISSNFDEAVNGLMNTRESFIAMDRTCSDAIFALTVLEQGVQTAEKKSREFAEKLVADTAQLSELDKMERERRSAALLTYTASLTTFLKEVTLAVTSLRGSQAVIQNILRMNQQAIESSNSHKITGIANTADAVTIIIGSIIDVCNRAASRTLADGLSRIRNRASEATARLTEGSYEALEQQNAQLSEFIDSVQSLRDTTKEITANTVELLKEQFSLVTQMRDESLQLAEATSDAQRTAFDARAGVIKDDSANRPAPSQHFGLHIGA